MSTPFLRGCSRWAVPFRREPMRPTDEMRCVDAAGHGTTWTGLRAAQMHRKSPLQLPSIWTLRRQTAMNVPKSALGSLMVRMLTRSGTDTSRLPSLCESFRSGVPGTAAAAGLRREPEPQRPRVGDQRACLSRHDPRLPHRVSTPRGCTRSTEGLADCFVRRGRLANRSGVRSANRKLKLCKNCVRWGRNGRRIPTHHGFTSRNTLAP